MGTVDVDKGGIPTRAQRTYRYHPDRRVNGSLKLRGACPLRTMLLQSVVSRDVHTPRADRFPSLVVRIRSPNGERSGPKGTNTDGKERRGDDARGSWPGLTPTNIESNVWSRASAVRRIVDRAVLSTP